MPEDVARLVEERGGDVRSDDDPAEGQVAAGDTFGESDHVRLEIEPGGGEPVADAAEAGDDLVGDVETACLSYRFPDLLQVALRNGAYPPGTHHRLDEDSGDALGTGVLDRLLDGLGVVVWDDGDVADELSVAGPVRLDPGQGGAVGVDAVVAPFPRDEDRALWLADGGEVAAGEFGGRVDGVGPADPKKTEPGSVTPRRSCRRDRAGTGGVIDEGVERRQLANLGIHRLDDLLSPVAHVLVPERRRSVKALRPPSDETPSRSMMKGVLDSGHVSEGAERSHARRLADRAGQDRSVAGRRGSPAVSPPQPPADGGRHDPVASTTGG